MRVAMVSERPDDGGYVAELAAALSRSGHDVTVHARRQHEDDPDSGPVRGGYRAVRVPAGPARPLSSEEIGPYLGEFAGALADDWRGDSPDVVHAHYWLAGLAALLATGQQRPPVVLTYHALATMERRHATPGEVDARLGERIRMERLVGRRASGILATCSDEVDELVTLGVPRAKTSLVPGGVDCEAFVPELLPPPRADRFRLLSVGPLVPHGGLDDVIVALAKVPAADLVIAGGSPADGLRFDEDAKRLRRRAEQAAVADRVRFVGHRPRHQRAQLMRWADAVVCAPWYEPLGLVALEAMASGTPVIATEVGCLRDSVVHQVTGEHVPTRRPDALAATLNRLSTDLVSLQEYGVAGRDRAMSRFDWDRIAVDAGRVYEQQLR